MTSPSSQELSDNETNFRILSFGPPPPATVRDVLDTDEQEEEGRPMIPPNENQPPALTPHEEAVPLLMNTSPGQNLLRSILIAEHERLHTTPPDIPHHDRTRSTDPPYPYQKNRGEDDEADINPCDYERQYLGAQVNKINGDPRVIGTNDADGPVYDEGPLNARPHEWGISDEDQEIIGDEGQQALQYNIGENAYLDPDFLKAMGEMDDRGLAAEGLRLVQLDGEFRHLKHWERKLTDRERANTLERGELIHRQTAAVNKQKEIATTDCEARKRRDVWGVGSPIKTDAPDYPSPLRPNHTLTSQKKKNDGNHPKGVLFGVKSEARSMGTRARIVSTHMSGLRTTLEGMLPCPPHTACRTTVRTSSTPVSVPIMGNMAGIILRGDHALRKKNDSEKGPGNGPVTVCRDGWGDRPASGNGCLHPNPGKRPDGRSGYLDAMVGASGIRTDTRRKRAR